jgi:hypothetical protein
MGHCFCLSDELNLTFQTESEPILTLTIAYSMFPSPPHRAPNVLNTFGALQAFPKRNLQANKQRS